MHEIYRTHPKNFQYALEITVLQYEIVQYFQRPGSYNVKKQICGSLNKILAETGYIGYFIKTNAMQLTRIIQK